MTNNPKNQHVITKNLLLQFANQEGFVKVFHKDTGRVRIRHVSSEGYIPNFISDNPKLSEEKWNQIEVKMEKIMLHISDRSFYTYQNDINTLKTFIALHLVRSNRIHRLVPVLAKQAADDTRFWLNGRKDISLEQKLEILPLLENELPNQAFNGPILRRTLFQLLEEISLDFITNNDLQIGIIKEGNLIIGDNPVVTFDNDRMEIDAPLKQTNVVYMPLSPKVVVSLPSKKRRLNGYIDINLSGVEKLNNLSTSAAYRKIYGDGI